MEGVCQKAPFFRAKFRYLNPLRWSNRAIRVFVAGFFMIMVPIYLYLGFLPASSLDYTNYPTLEIPTINLSTPVAKIELQDRELIAPATIAGVYQPHLNKLFIIGHSSTVFKNLHQISENALFSYENQTYQVQSISTLEKSAIDMKNILSPTEEKTIIIMTCAGTPLPNQDATHRLIITATLLE